MSSFENKIIYMFGICLIPVIPLREEPSSKSQMVSQLLFGEKYKVLHTQPNWIKIQSVDDEYQGWINDTQVNYIEENEWNQLNTPNVIKEYPHQLIEINDSKMYVPTGSIIYNPIGSVIANFEIKIKHQEMELTLEQIAFQYLNTAYLWGGRTPWGIDCSGFTQTVFKQLGIQLKRDAYQQAEQGEPLAFLSQAQMGDLAFFDNDEGKITHVGILLSNQKIIHASGKVKIEDIDNHGIINNETKKYSHKLRFIKRIKTN